MSAPKVEVKFKREWSGAAGCPDVYEEPLSAADLVATLDGRPLVVIDPEDRETVARLCQDWFDGDEPADVSVDNMQAALRSLIADPKPDEPTGLGAVVEDAEGRRWVRCENADLEPHWYAQNKQKQYGQIAAVRILSEGVTR